MTTDEVLRARTVVVSHGRIVTIGAVDDTVVPEGATVVDGTDRYVMPGLVEMHGHVPPASSGDLERILALQRYRQSC